MADTLERNYIASKWILPFTIHVLLPITVTCELRDSGVLSSLGQAVSCWFQGVGSCGKTAFFSFHPPYPEMFQVACLGAEGLLL